VRPVVVLTAMARPAWMPAGLREAGTRHGAAAPACHGRKKPLAPGADADHRQRSAIVTGLVAGIVASPGGAAASAGAETVVMVSIAGGHTREGPGGFTRCG
jgi:hypothetical protein